MRVDCALLCDAATVREGLLHVLGGGITRAGRPVFPAPLNLTLALRILIHPTESEAEHQLVIRLQGEDGQEAARVEVGFGVEDRADLAPGEQASLPLPIPLHGVPLPAPGRYSFELLIDGIHQASVPFIALPIDLPQLEQQQGEDDE